MIRVLCLEDNDSAADELRGIAELALAPTRMEFDRFSSVIDAKQAAKNKQYDVALVDVQVPLRKLESPRKDGGLIFLEYVLTSPHAKRPRYVVGITTEKELFESARPQFSQSLFAILERDSASELWKSALGRFFSYVGSQEATQASNARERCGPVSLAIYCAIATTELDALRRWFGVTFARLDVPNDPTEYWLGKMVGRSGEHSVLAIGAPEQGMPVAAALTAKVIQKFCPLVVATCGVAAAIEATAGFGDVLVADQTWDHTTGKRVGTPDGRVDTRSENRSIRVDPLIIDQTKRLSADSKFLQAVSDEWPAQKPRTALRACCGPFASGGSVIEAPSIRDEIIERDRKTIGIDMEAHAVAAACWYSTHPATPAIVVKSVVDYGVPPKTDAWHPYAAYTSVRFLSEWAKRFL
jgi:nucleoside phosphorylase